MTAFVARRLLLAVPVVFGVTLVTFVLMHVTAGNYVPGLELAPDMKAADVARLRASLGLDRPLAVQYLDWIGLAALLEAIGLASLVGGSGNVTTGLLEGDFGRSLIDGTPVLSAVLDRLPNTIELAGTALLLGLLLGCVAGVLGALHRGSWFDQALTGLSVAGFAVPEFWLGLLLILLFSVSFHAWGLPSLPAGGANGAFGGGIVDRLQHLVMPAVVLAFLYVSSWSRFVRSSMIEVLSQDYLRTAKAKGMRERRAIWVHALRNALAPLITLAGLELPGLISGSLVVEVVFNWPGIGLLAYQRALQYDYTTVMGITTVAAIVVVLGNLLADVAYGIVDPRVRLT